MIIALLGAAQAAPTEVPYTGRLFDATGLPLNGAHDLVLTLFDSASSGSPVWQEAVTVDFDAGYFTVMLGQSTALDDTVFNGASKWLQVSVDGTVAPDRLPIGSVPYAVRAGSVSSPSLGGLSCSFGEVALYDGTAWGCNSPIVNWSNITGLPADLGNGDDDVVGELSCTAGQVPKFDGSAWMCADDDAATDALVDLFVENGPLNLAAGTTMNTRPLATLPVDWSDLTGLPSGFEDGVDDTADEAEVEGFVTNDAIDLFAGSTMDGSPLLSGAVGDATYVNLAGDVMTGDLTIDATNPTLGLNADSDLEIEWTIGTSFTEDLVITKADVGQPFLKLNDGGPIELTPDGGPGVTVGLGGDLTAAGHVLGSRYAFMAFASDVVSFPGINNHGYFEQFDPHDVYTGGLFVAPVDGMYFFTSSAMFNCGSGGDDAGSFSFRVNDSDNLYKQRLNPAAQSPDCNSEFPFSHSAILLLNAGDDVQPWYSGMDTEPVEIRNRSFAGFYLGG